MNWTERKRDEYTDGVIDATIEKLREVEPDYIDSYAAGDGDYALYLRMVDVWIHKLAHGLTHRDLPHLYRADYDQSLTPRLVATNAIRENKKDHRHV
jgi:hypothetical protein